jgi:hypothetical protein
MLITQYTCLFATKFISKRANSNLTLQKYVKLFIPKNICGTFFVKSAFLISKCSFYQSFCVKMLVFEENNDILIWQLGK